MPQMKQSSSAVLPASPRWSPNGSRPLEQSEPSALRVRIAQVLVAAAAVLLVCCVVIPEHFPPWTGYHTEVLGFAAATTLLLAAAFRRSTRCGAPVVVLLALATTPWLQWMAGLVLYAGDAWVATAYVAVFAAAWWWGSNERTAAETPPTLDLIIGCLVLMAVLGAWQGLAQWLQVETFFGGWVYELVTTTRSSGNIGQPNQLATLLLMASSGCAVWMVRGRLGVLAGWALLLLFAWCLVLTQSRTGLLSAVLLVVSLAIACACRPSMRPWLKHGVAWLVVVLAGSYLLQTGAWEFAKPPLGGDAMGSVGTRPVIWRQMLFALAAHPWAGYGWLQVSIAQQEGALRLAGVEQTNYAHNILLDSAVMLGVPLTLALLGLACVWLGRRLLRLRSDDGTATAALLVVLPWAVHTMLELPHAYSYFLVPVGMLLGLFEIRTAAPEDRSWHVAPWAVHAAAAGLVVMLGALAMEYAAVEEDFRVNRFENRRLGQTPAAYVYPDLKLLTQFQDMLRAMRLRAAPGMAADDVAVLVRSARRLTWAPLEFRAALALGLNGQPDTARRHLLVIKTLFGPEVVDDARNNWKLQQDKYPVLAGIPFP